MYHDVIDEDWMIWIVDLRGLLLLCQITSITFSSKNQAIGHSSGKPGKLELD
jgi:hypothetical protein